MKQVGERIRELRKERKLTLEALAGDQLSKGMLSLIENNKANPSMESLSYLAKRLEVDIAELLAEVTPAELRLVLEEAEKLYSVPIEMENGENEQLITILEPYITKLPERYEGARLLDLYGRALFLAGQEGWEEAIDKASAMYERLHIVTKWITIRLFLSFTKTKDHSYAEALQMLLSDREYLSLHYSYIEPISEISLDYYEAIYRFAVGQYEQGIQVMNHAIEFSKSQQIFYRVDSLYRLAAITSLMNGQQDEYESYVEKLELYSQFSGDEDPLGFLNFIKLHHLTTYEKDYDKAQSMIAEYKVFIQQDGWPNAYLFLEEGKVLYGLCKYQEALHAFEMVEIPSYLNHPLDLSPFYSMEAYMAKCCAALGESEQAAHYAKKAYEQMALMPDSPYKEFVLRTYDEIIGNNE